jgi:hypothetical protein
MPKAAQRFPAATFGAMMLARQVSRSTLSARLSSRIHAAFSLE